MDHSFKLLTSMSPAIAPNTKRILIKKRAPRKLALKKNIRRSSQFDKLPPTEQNNSLVIVNSSLEDIESPIIPVTTVETVTKTTDDFINELSVTRYAEIKDWVTEVNIANNYLSDEECENIIWKYVTERRKRSNFQIETDLQNSTFDSVKTDGYNENNCKNDENPHKDRTCIIISSSSDGSSVDSYKSACSDVVIIESSFKYSESDYTIEKSNLILSEPQKKKAAVKCVEPPITEGKVAKAPPTSYELSWSQRLKQLCDSDTTDSSFRVDINNPNSKNVPTTRCTGDSNKNGISCNQEPIKKQIRKKLSFNEILESLSNKENCNNVLNTAKKGNKIGAIKDNCDKFSELDGNKKKNTSKINKQKVIHDILYKGQLSDYSHKTAKDNLLNKNTKQYFYQNKEINQNNHDEYEADKNDECIKSNDEKYFSDVSSDYESLEDKLRKKNFDIDFLKNKLETEIPKEKKIFRTNISTEKLSKKINTKKIHPKFTHDQNHKKVCVKLDEDKTKSFLESLSGCVKISQCDPSARIFRNNFQAYKNQLTTKLFKLYNEKVFDNAIPDDSPIEWSDRMRGTAGYCYCRKIVRSTGELEKKIRIVLSSKVLDSADRLRDTLIHELCHAATWVVNGVANGHGDCWRAWTIKARQVFPELPPINRCHDYVINTKYTYRCINCGYSFGRHSKSLDLNTKRCGYCLSKFELLINKKCKDGEVKSIPATPKKEPTGFALFVKENYSVVKTPQLNHGQVMKLLGQKFNELKV